jgi:hypothetical protein
MNPSRRWHALDAVRDTFADLKAHPATTLGSAVIFCIPVAFLSLYQALRPNFLSLVLQGTVSFVIVIWLSFAIVMVTKQFAEGSDPGIGGLLRSSTSAGLIGFVVTQLLLIAAETFAVAVAILPIAGAFASLGARANFSPDQMNAGNAAVLAGAFMLSFVLVIAFLLMIYLRYGLGPVISALEARSPTQSFTRSRDLTEGKRLDFFVLLLITLGIGMAVSLVINGPGMVVSLGAVASAPPPEPRSLTELLLLFIRQEPLVPAAALVVAVSDYLAYAVSIPISAALLANFYLGISGDEVTGIRSRQTMPADEGSVSTSTEPMN